MNRWKSLPLKATRITALIALLAGGCAFSSAAPSNEPLVVTLSPAAASTAALASSLQPSITDVLYPPPSNLPASPPTAASTSQPSATLAPDLFQSALPLSEQSYLLPLTVRHVTENSSALFFELSQPAAGALFYRPAADASAGTSLLPLTPGQTRQQITLSSLTPATEYLVQVGLEYPGLAQPTPGSYRQPAFLGAAWGPLRFRTATAEQPLRVGVIGDASFGDPGTEALVARISDYNLDFVIHTGDVVDLIEQNKDAFEAYALKFYKTFAPLLHQMPVYTVIGNHDYDPEARWLDSYFYYYAFPPATDPGSYQTGKPNELQYYAFSYQNIQFLMLDTQVFFGIPGWDEQDAWMLERLANSSFRFTIPVLHVPPYFSGAVHPGDSLPVRQFWHPAFVNAHVPLALSGHSHHYERLLSDGITYIVSGGGSSTLYGPGQIQPQSQAFANRTHFVLLEIYADRIELTAIAKEGDILDRAVIPLTR